jgi:hypothetical protein
MEEQKEVQRQFREQQQKFNYYILALSVTAIGFSIYNTTGKQLHWTQIPLALSIMSWGLSIFFGFRFLKYVLNTLFANNQYFEIIKGNDPKVGNHPEMKNIAIDAIKTVMSNNSVKAKSFSRWQERLFYIGILLFIVWHVTEMYQNTL